MKKTAPTAAAEAQIRGGHPDLEGLCLALSDWCAELRLLQASRGLATIGPRLAHVRFRGDRLACGPTAVNWGRFGQEWWPQAETPAKPKRGGGLMLLVEAISPFSALGLEGLDLVPGLLQGAGHKAADRVPLPVHGFHNLGNRRAVLPLQHRDDLGGFAPFPRPSGVLRLRGLFALGRGLGGLCATLGLLVGLGLRGRRSPFRTTTVKLIGFRSEQ